MSEQDNRPVLVTGGCGFIGCNLADRLAERGDRVLVLDNLARAGVRENAQWLKSRHGDRVAITVADIRDPIPVIDAVREARAVLHLAAQVAVTDSVSDPSADFEINARGTLNVLEAVRLHNASAPVIFASTNKVYGRLIEDSEIALAGRRYTPVNDLLAGGISENAPLDFYSPYGCSKGTADQYVHDYARVFGLQTVVVRMSCIYGPRQFGTEDQGWIAHFLLSAISGNPLTIYGDGKQVRDALHVSDAVSAWLAALDHIALARGRVFNLGGGPGNAVSLLELIDRITELTGRKVSYRFADWRPGDQPWYVTDTRALATALGWTPQMPLADGLRSLHTWLDGRFGSQARSEALA
ncbi:SDR family NAD(P)-dependent oxidoreductase [Bradyrhizobium sp. NBAIM20]|uniref:SDR family NAD(P)-dependent oxidoreductase n=1 Tax=unclassified Bradyrhizobium TaxID=2631580 RepID=UPI001CD44A0B|nr:MULTISPECIES: SDR family NAD(P)-dependent oxidoreductase [unclassified Bradyrhizobium]MCA1412629.1 SDR family NAD(P)-dependent oxidoreductase [Bradyrhizobium sp. NBAIM20]MCA1465104.1 SDR family NAD(P)-dependent oxidoreductase [Bradyrhizobium sp. NBAIM18]